MRRLGREANAEATKGERLESIRTRASKIEERELVLSGQTFATDSGITANGIYVG